MDFEKLQEIKQKYLAEINFRKNADGSQVDYKYDIMVCGGTGCRSCKSKSIEEKLIEVIKSKNLERDIKVHGVGCFGLCVNGPVILIYPQDAMYIKVSIDDVEEIIDKLIGGELVERLLPEENGKKITKKNELQFCKK